MNNIKKIVCLPPVSIKNPYQHLMIQGLKTNKKLKIIRGFSSRYIGIILSGLIYRPNYIHFDWINKYYLKKNRLLTLLNISWFLIQILFLKKIMKINIVWTMHNLFPHDSNQIKIDKFIQKKFIDQCKWIRVFSKLTVPKVVNEFDCQIEKIIVVPEGSYINYYPNKIKRQEARERLKINTEKIFLYIGTIKPYKGIINLIDIFSKIKNDNIKLIIVGKVMNENYLGEINNRINNTSIKLINEFIDPNELQIFFNAADAVILPFNNIENSGSAILAMGFKKVIIAPNIGILPNRLKNQREFLYTKNIEKKINLIISREYNDLLKIGNKNFLELKKYKWSDFGDYFLN